MTDKERIDKLEDVVEDLRQAGEINNETLMAIGRILDSCKEICEGLKIRTDFIASVLLEKEIMKMDDYADPGVWPDVWPEGD